MGLESRCPTCGNEYTTGGCNCDNHNTPHYYQQPQVYNWLLSYYICPVHNISVGTACACPLCIEEYKANRNPKA